MEALKIIGVIFVAFTLWGIGFGVGFYYGRYTDKTVKDIIDEA